HYRRLYSPNQNNIKNERKRKFEAIHNSINSKRLFLCRLAEGQLSGKSKRSDSHLQTSIKNNNDCRNPSICSMDTLSHLSELDQLLPIIQYVVIRSGIMYLDAELDFIEHLVPRRLSLHGLLPYLMNTLQACYNQILNKGSSI
ncbi:unnamed protein product, partial [Schistosoma margrebowiei]